MTPEAEIRALVVTRDAGLATTFTQISREFGIDAQQTGKDIAGVPAELELSKYEALLIDFETVPQTVPILTSLRQSAANRNAVIFAAVRDSHSRQRARDQGATFLLEKPLHTEDTRRVLHAAYGLMTRERRRYFRCAAELDVELVRDSGEEIAGKTLNISSNGMAVSTPAAFNAGEKLHLEFILANSGVSLRAHAVVVWDDKHGKTGLSMECVSPQMQVELDSWLDANFSRLLQKPN